MLRIRRDLAPVPDRRGGRAGPIPQSCAPPVYPLPTSSCVHSSFPRPLARGSTDSPPVGRIRPGFCSDAATGGPGTPAASAMVFIPKWDGAEGSAGGGTSSPPVALRRGWPRVADGDQLIGLPEDGQPYVVFSIVGASLKSAMSRSSPSNRGSKVLGEDVTVWVVRGAHVVSRRRRTCSLDDCMDKHASLGARACPERRPRSERRRQGGLHEFTHHCKAEAAPTPLRKRSGPRGRPSTARPTGT